VEASLTADSATHRIGIDLGGTKIEGVVLAPDGRVLRRERIATEREGGYEHVLGRVCALAQSLLADASDAPRFGIGTPGSTSPGDGTLRNSNTTCLNGRPLHADLEARLGFPVVMENDANCFALAEARHGAARGARVVFGVILGTGVGGGIVVDGRLWSGAQHVAGEWGHHRVALDGPECYCGRRGCVETLLSGPALARRFAEVAGGDSDAATIAARAAAGDAHATRVMDDYVASFGRALANVVNVLDPDVIVLGGGLSNLDCLYDAGVAAVREWIFSDAPEVRIVRNALGDSAGVIGAALLEP
jgi:fructokinase